MIQRIQSLYLLLAAGTFGSLFGLPFVTIETEMDGYLANQSFEIQDHIVLTVLTLAGALLAFLAIFLFRKRRLQILFSYLALITGLLAIPVSAWFLLTNDLPDQNSIAALSVSLGLYVPVVIAVLIFLAIRHIKKDDKIVRSMDRLR